MPWADALAIARPNKTGNIGGRETRAMIEAPLSYVDWLFFLPFAWFYIALLIVPGSDGPNRFGYDSRHEAASKTADPGRPEPAV